MKAEYQDKIAHAIFCAIASMLVAVIIAHTTTEPTPCCVGGFFGGVMLGAGKEFGDYRSPDNTWSWGDFLADIVGAFVGCWAGFVTYGIW